MNPKCWLIRDSLGRYLSLVPLSRGQTHWTHRREEAIEFSSLKNALAVQKSLANKNTEITEQYATKF